MGGWGRARGGVGLEAEATRSSTKRGGGDRRGSRRGSEHAETEGEEIREIRETEGEEIRIRERDAERDVRHACKCDAALT